ncbi:MAG: thioesterase domain-containing protein, partial [Acidobacteriota bacterium]
PQRSEEYIEPRDGIEEGLVRIWETMLGVSPVGISDNFFDLGGHSLHAARFCGEIEARYDRRIPLATLLENPTIEGFARFLRGDDCEASWSSLVKLQPEGSKPPLFCVHACGAHVFIYRPLIHRLSADQPVYGMQAKGLDGKEECPTRIEEMAANYVKEIRGIQPQGPYYLLGDTLGGLIALEIAQQLYDQGQVTAFLCLLDTSCPLPKSISERVMAHITHVKELGPRQYVLEATLSVRRKLARLRSKEIPLTAAEKELERSVLSDSDPIARVEWAIYQATIVNYRVPKRIYPGKITYFFARDNIYDAREEDKRLRWKTIAGGGFELHVVPGRHDTIKEEPHVALLSRKLMECLVRAQS